MSNVHNTRIQHLEFPECTKEALNFLTKHYTNDSHRGLPGRGSSGEKLAIDVAQEFVIEIFRRKGHKNKVYPTFSI